MVCLLRWFLPTIGNFYKEETAKNLRSTAITTEQHAHTTWGPYQQARNFAQRHQESNQVPENHQINLVAETHRHKRPKPVANG